MTAPSSSSKASGRNLIGWVFGTTPVSKVLGNGTPDNSDGIRKFIEMAENSYAIYLEL
jgi:hypothetical protein